MKTTNYSVPTVMNREKPAGWAFACAGRLLKNAGGQLAVFKL